ncbi:histidine kinase [Spongiivirga sp. MCCC 1A20706]|uniref:sensor histidine kinase n=1 Tax=Spongiivirga sp. MCCC 1A20706 TaxID=3160963 RepID=UPI003977407C
MKSEKLLSLFGYRNTTQRIIRHLLFWGFFVFYNVATWGAYNEDVVQTILFELYYLPAKLLMSYFTLYYIIPKLLLPKKYAASLIWFAIGLIVTGLINRAVTYYVIYPINYPEGLSTGFWTVKVFYDITINFNITTLVAAIKLVQHWYKTEGSRQQLAQEKTAAELKLLKSQLHPHFLFNTLNSLYALTLEQSKKTPDVVLKLSSLLNYMLYDCNKPLVPLEKELTYINDYILLEQLRYGNKLSLSYETSGDFTAHRIAPLIILPFIENAFKHGASQHTQAPWIRCNLLVDGKQFHLQIENSIDPTQAVNEQIIGEEDRTSQGVGLINVKKRLELLYKDRYTLHIAEDDSFLVNLKLYLD